MSGTFEDIYGNIYPVSRVVKIKRDKTERDPFKLPRHKVYVDFRDDEILVSLGLDDIIQQLSPAIPAAPGYSLLTFWYDPDPTDPDAEPHIEVRPVIAWRIGGPNGNHPVTFREDYDRDVLRAHDALEDHQGRVTDAEESVYESRGDWIAFMKERRDQEFADRAAVKAAGSGDE